MRRTTSTAFAMLLLLASSAAADPSNPRSSSVIELRQYTLRPGQRDVLIDLFEREFIESQEAVGIRVLGSFRDLDHPDHFVWIRGFRDLTSRVAALEAFYAGAAWRAHRAEANATMLETDNVLLLNVAHADSGLDTGNRSRPSDGAAASARGLVIASIYSVAAPVGSEFVDFFDRMVEPLMKEAGITVRASYVSATSPNNYPRLPVRENEHVFVWFATFADPRDYAQGLARLEQSATWRTVEVALRAKLKGQPEVLRLEPTPRSALTAGFAGAAPGSSPSPRR